MTNPQYERCPKIVGCARPGCDCVPEKSPVFDGTNYFETANNLRKLSDYYSKIADGKLQLYSNEINPVAELGRKLVRELVIHWVGE